MKNWIGAFTGKSQSALGVITLLCGFLMMLGSARGGLKDTQTIDRILGGAIDIDPLHPTGLNNGKIVVAPGRFSSEDRLEDEFIKPGPYLILRRRVEMFQWAEKRGIDGVSFEYDLDWHEGQIDFFRFRETAGHENPLLKIQPEVRRVASSTFGGFDGSVLLRSIEGLLPLKITRDLLKDDALEIVNNAIVIPRDTLTKGRALGDMRISYEVLPRGDYTILTRQVDERSLIGVESSGGVASQSVVVRQGVYSADQLRKMAAQEVRSAASGLMYLGATILFFGLFSVLLPLAPRVSLRPRLELEGIPALMVVCLGVTAAMLALFMILRQF